ncbi:MULTISPECIES: ATP-binding protein [unclassified Photobacterium]|uniref:ATP-binding protein n=1 Tax=unclassified Photobacterium TaxID=2628852 RepID=UPI000D1652ED|nr:MULTISPECIES: ATP-binding protein [unclassified Photobacterium]PSV25397.1 hybrid sensor histidine kinase/response regulator [Photobacterium sp. GB-56]PSV30097.1 hybrid sensor histidine kinase/response regulator [Photobacterium sp. GB-72]PSV38082.1 hybrid sensor histidine kinase/response regulator [Photobacterium sp. GB-210]PSV41311.1 hybrid sensor histidine kinase/response regulator [Photobacterium sp. GB-36]PSV54055.1 hybrid sensor histidine kinase/response regulator [Photobacterium sp. GB
MIDPEKHIALLKQKLQREHASRLAAEKLLEAKSHELYNANQMLNDSYEKLQMQAKFDSELLTYQNKMENLLLLYARLFLKHSATRESIQQLLDSLVDGNYISGCHITIYPADNINISGSYSSGRLQQWTPPAELESTHSLWDKGGHTLWINIVNNRGQIGILAVRIICTDDRLPAIQKHMALFGELFRSAIGRQITFNQAIDAKKRAEDSERSTRDFLAMINHELRTPLNGLLGAAELLQDTPLNNDQQKLLTTLNHSGELLRAIINDLLDYSKINAGMLELIEKPFDCHLLAVKLEDIFTHRSHEKRLDFNIYYSHDLPRFFIGDEDRIKQIFVNLISNAIKFTPAGFVHAKFWWQNKQLQFTVKDSGCGIDHSNQHKLFKPFSQVDNTSKRSHEGTGLGLVICKQLCEQMGGSIRVESSLGRGACFNVSLPLPTSDHTHFNAKVRQPHKTPIKHLKVLVVEDLKTNQMIIKLMLNKIQIEPTIVDNGQKALDILNAESFDVVFMDCRMPIMDGYTATRELRKQDYSKPIIALTAGTTSAEREACIQAGMNDILCKPYLASELHDILTIWGSVIE